MNRWLVSVRNLEEVTTVLAEGPDIIDLKEPKEGALGALPSETICQAVGLIGGRCPTSATIGDLSMKPAPICHAVEQIAATGVNYVKIGLFPDGRVPDCLVALQPLAVQGVSLVGVMFADKQPNFSWISLMQQAGFTGAMLDTATKDGRNLLSHLSLAELSGFVQAVRSGGLVSGLAGSLSFEDIPKLLPLGADYLGFRSALCCAGQRQSSLDPKAIVLLKRALNRR
ncbi:(5-formylfuran-3-yl)methyl phosphate synthase [Nitrosococcus wardiae]|uniref:(5-formylfuran-3-yl)methyl phosphate synthase n=1 Tax=Nitrosococcus wardiae TaxID=1814290 RepID=A0A4P7BUX9_9GAMM|nr:(5-formylfuran-3-yl)methyl phosphate synthase [Nitrosococcus wardiae]QBQ53778.1 hypothetical protein E3U44_04070 [Nitrosococcus wardiae]